MIYFLRNNTHDLSARITPLSLRSRSCSTTATAAATFRNITSSGTVNGSSDGSSHSRLARMRILSDSAAHLRNRDAAGYRSAESNRARHTWMCRDNSRAPAIRNFTCTADRSFRGAIPPLSSLYTDYRVLLIDAGNRRT